MLFKNMFFLTVVSCAMLLQQGVVAAEQNLVGQKVEEILADETMVSEVKFQQIGNMIATAADNEDQSDLAAMVSVIMDAPEDLAAEVVVALASYVNVNAAEKLVAKAAATSPAAAEAILAAVSQSSNLGSVTKAALAAAVSALTGDADQNLDEAAEQVPAEEVPAEEVPAEADMPDDGDLENEVPSVEGASSLSPEVLAGLSQLAAISNETAADYQR